MFPRNEGAVDRMARAILGAGLFALAAGLKARRPLGLGAGLVGTVLLFTAATGSCQLYRPLGFDTTRQG